MAGSSGLIVAGEDQAQAMAGGEAVTSADYRIR